MIKELEELLQYQAKDELSHAEMMEQLFFLVARHTVDEIVSDLPSALRESFTAWVRDVYDNPTPVEDLVYIDNSPEPPEMRSIIRELREWIGRLDRSSASAAKGRRVWVAELRMREETVEILARFVLQPDGTVVTVAATEHYGNVADKTVADGVPGPQDTKVKRDQGMRFLQLLAENFRGSRFYATRVFAMDEAEAMVVATGPAPPRR